MLRWIIRDDLEQLLSADHISEQRVPNDEGKPEEDQVLYPFLKYLLPTPRGFGKRALGRGVAFD